MASQTPFLTGFEVPAVWKVDLINKGLELANAEIHKNAGSKFWKVDLIEKGLKRWHIGRADCAFDQSLKGGPD